MEFYFSTTHWYEGLTPVCAVYNAYTYTIYNIEIDKRETFYYLICLKTRKLIFEYHCTFLQTSHSKSEDKYNSIRNISLIYFNINKVITKYVYLFLIKLLADMDAYIFNIILCFDIQQWTPPPIGANFRNIFSNYWYKIIKGSAP